MSPISGELERIVRTVLAPLVEADGGELYLVRIEDGEVELHLTGRFSGCAGNELVTQRVLHPALRRANPAVRLTVSSGRLIPERATRVRPESLEDSAESGSKPESQ